MSAPLPPAPAIEFDGGFIRPTVWLIAWVRDCWSAGYTESAMAAHLGVGKGCISGLRRRHVRPDTPRAKTRRTRVVRVERRKPYAGDPVPKAAPEPVRSTLPPLSCATVAEEPARAAPPPMVGRHDCCWPIGDPGTKGFRFCGGRAVTGRPYCPEHCGVAYIPIRRRAAA